MAQQSRKFLFHQSKMNWLTGDGGCDAAILQITDETLPFSPEASLASWLDLADKIKAKTLSGPGIIKSLIKRLGHDNPNVVVMTVKLTGILSYFLSLAPELLQIRWSKIVDTLLSSWWPKRVLLTPSSNCKIRPQIRSFAPQFSNISRHDSI